jgi:hypothetical protein
MSVQPYWPSKRVPERILEILVISTYLNALLLVFFANLAPSEIAPLTCINERGWLRSELSVAEPFHISALIYSDGQGGVQHGFRPGKKLGKITATTAAPKKEIPVSRAMRRPWRKSFSAKMTMVSAAIAGIFITPTATRISIKPQQQPTQ